MRRVLIESPYAGSDTDVMYHMRYLQRCIRDCVYRGESPYASHQMLTQALDDRNVTERELGINAGHAFLPVVDLVVVYTDLGISSGMEHGIKRAKEHNVPVIYRSLENSNARPAKPAAA